MAVTTQNPEDTPIGEEPISFISTPNIDVEEIWRDVSSWFIDEMLSISSLIQCGWLIAAFILAFFTARAIRPAFIEWQERFRKYHWLQLTIHAAEVVLTPLIAFLYMATYPAAAQLIGGGESLARLFTNLLGAWVIIQFASSFIRYPKLARTLALTVWVIAALNTFGVLEEVILQLDAIGFHIGDARISILTLAKSAIAVILLFWLAMALSRFFEKQVDSINQLTPSLRVLISKTVRTVFIIFAGLIGLNTLGIDLTSLAVFSGAIGVGVGFGLQKVVSNFISGIILLLDRSIKPGDVIAVDQTYGWVNKLSARHVSVITRDGKEHLIPNELLITERVENWSYSDRNVRLKIPVKIAYECNPREALKLMLEVAAETPRVLKFPKPNALVMGFDDSSVQLELRAWIDDPANGIGNITSEIYLNLWDKFKEYGIRIPFPQRDVHLDQSMPLRVVIGRDEEREDAEDDNAALIKVKP